VGPTARDTSGRIVDAKGAYVIPGLWDMHTHAFFGERTPESRDLILPLFVANGVTGIRDMGSALEPVLRARADVAAHRLLGPRMIVSGPMLDGRKVSLPASIAITTPAVGLFNVGGSGRAAQETEAGGREPLGGRFFTQSAR